MAMRVEILVIRAGRTCWDEAHRVQGRTDLPLTERGRADVTAALDASASLVPKKMAVIYCGPDEGTQETAMIVTDQFGGKVKPLDELAGWDFGLWHGLQESELSARHTKAWERWIEDPTSVTPPNGERASEVQERIGAALRRIARKAETKQVGVVLRPLQIALLGCWLDGTAPSDLWRMAHRVCQVQRVRLDPETLRGDVLAMTTKATV